MDEIETITEEEYEKLAAEEEAEVQAHVETVLNQKVRGLNVVARDLPNAENVAKEAREEYWASKLPCGDDEVNK